MAVDYTKEGRVAIFTINRPEAMNALNTQVHVELNEAMLDFNDNPDLWVGIITGAGDRAFSAGADIKEFTPDPSDSRHSQVPAPSPARGIHFVSQNTGVPLATRSTIICERSSDPSGGASVHRPSGTSSPPEQPSNQLRKSSGSETPIPRSSASTASGEAGPGSVASGACRAR